VRREAWIDWDVIFLLLGMMVIVGVIRQTGLFEYLGISGRLVGQAG
jgi:Na+/H+ antiporter NhaD/arsenite permease-like protein